MYRKILLTYDGTIEGRCALREGAEVARTFGAQTHLLAVIAAMPSLASPETALPQIDFDQEEQVHRAILNEGVQILRDSGLTTEGHMAYGDPVDQISAHAAQLAVDLIVVGHRNRGRLERWWTGSVGRSLLDHTQCSVLVAVVRDGDA